MNGPDWLIPVIAIGPIIGLAGGIYGTYRSITRTTSPAERSLMVRFSIGLWLALILLLGLPLVLVLTHVLPDWMRWPPFFIFFGLLGPVGKWVTTRQTAIRAEAESGERPEG